MDLSPPHTLSSERHLGSKNVHLFQPPASPALLATPTFSSSKDYFANISRKRQRPDSAQSRDSSNLAATWTETPSWAQCPTPSDGIYGSAHGLNRAQINERYRLADGFDTPVLESTARLELLTVDEHEFRRRIRDEDMGNTLRSDFAPLSGPLARERNGYARIQPVSGDTNSKTSWTNFAFGIVGKVFSFGTNVFKGFYAGGGQGYDLQQDHPLADSDLLDSNRDGMSTPIPGSWVQDDFLGDFEQDSPSFSQQPPVTRPPNKRRQTDRDSWVMVGNPESELGPSPRRKVSSNAVPRSSLASRPQASRASSRKNIAPLPRRTSSYAATSGSPPQQSMPPPQFPSTSDRRASFAPTRSPHGRPSNNGENWMSPEAERFVKRQAKQERVADKAMSSMGKRMEEMIRQAQEALGTKYSVEGDLDMDEGYVDDGW